MTLNLTPNTGAASATAGAPSHPTANRLRTLAAGGLTSLLSAVFCSRHGRISRPKLLFATALADFLLVTLAGLAAADIARAVDGTASGLLWREAIIGFALVMVLHRNWSYSVASLRSRSGQMIKVASSALTVFLALAGLSFIAGLAVWTPWHFALWLALTVASLSLARLATASIIEASAADGLLRRRTVIAGGGKEAADLIAALGNHDAGHLEILGVFDDRQGDRAADYPGDIAMLGTFEELTAFCQKSGVDLVIVTVPPRAEERVLQVLQKLFPLEVDIRVSALNSKLRLNASAYNYIGDVPMLAVMDKPLSDWDRVVKNVADRVLGLLILLAMSPIMLATALAVRLGSKGPIFFKQKRYGFNNELIEVFKFRSMYTEMSDATASKLVTKDDPRVTPVGRFIRKTSLDELPQLINVLKGEMSLVGPRPHAVTHNLHYGQIVDGYKIRHKVKPGITGLAQISGCRGETSDTASMQRRIDHDVAYIRNWSWWLDLKILALTPLRGFVHPNAY